MTKEKALQIVCFAKKFAEARAEVNKMQDALEKVIEVARIDDANEIQILYTSDFYELADALGAECETVQDTLANFHYDGIKFITVIH